MDNDFSLLYETFLNLKTPKDVEDFLLDLCSKDEIKSMAQRIMVAKLLMEGETYEQIISKTDLSSTTLSRVSKCVKNGNGYKNFVK